MIAANSPLKLAAPPPDWNPNPTRIRRRRRLVCSSDLSSRPLELKLPVRWSRLRSDYDFTPVANDSRIKNPEPDHLVIMVNGIIGSGADWKFAAGQFDKRLHDKVLVHCSRRNYATLTFDGVDTMGERLAEEVLSIVHERRSTLKKISFVSHSLGGLVARYAIGRLYKCETTSDPSGINGKIAGLEPMNFVTVATPHLGSRGHKQLPFLLGLPFLERSAPQTAHLLVGRTGKHLFLTDDEEGKPLLLRMVNDSGALKFISALRVFKRRVAYANANFDHMVGWRTSSIRRQNELPKSNQLVPDERYPYIVHVEGESYDVVHNKWPSEQNFDWEEEMIRGLTQVSWERVDVSFQKSGQRFIAHSTIQVNRYWLNSDGQHVVYHIIDNFLQ